MDNQTLLTQLANTVSSDNQLRKQAEVILLKQNASIILQILALLNSNMEIPPQLQLISLTLIKTRISADWNLDSTTDELRESIKSEIIQFMVNFENPFLKSNHPILRMTLKIIDILLLNSKIHFQYELLNFSNDLILKNLKSIESLYIGILLIRQVSKRNRNSNNYDLLNNISSNFGPLYLGFLQSYNEELQTSKEVSPHKRLLTYGILKTLNYISTTRIPIYFQESDNLHKLCTNLTQLFYLFLTVSESGKNCKWILRFFIKLQTRSIGIVDNSIYPASFISLLKNIIIPFNVSTILEYITKSENLLDNFITIDDDNDNIRTIYYFIVFLTKSINKLTYSILAQYLNVIISNIIVKILSVNAQDLSNFEIDQTDFINSFLSNDLSGPSDVTSAGSLFIIKLTKFNPEIVDPLLSLSTDILNSSDKQSYMCSLNILKIIQTNIDQSLLNSITLKIIEINKAITNPDDLWLRCLIFDFLSNLKNVSLNFQELCLNLDPTEQPLPLLVSTLKLIIVKSQELENPVDLMQILLNLTESENLEIITDLIDILVEKFPQQLGPYSNELIDNLSNSFMRLLEEEGEHDKEDQLINILNNILTVIISCNDKEMIILLNKRLGPIIATILDNGILDLLELTIDLNQELNLKSNTVLNLDTILNSFKNFGFDYFEYYQSYFETVYLYGNPKQRYELNTLIKWIIDENPSGLDTEDLEFIEFLSNLISEMVISSTNENDNEDDGGLSDEIFKTILEFLYNLFEDKEQFWNNKIIFRSIMGGFYKKPLIILSIFGNDNIKEILNRFENLINNGIWCTVYDLKLGILGLLEILKTNNNDEIKAMVMSLLSTLCNNINKAIERRDKLLNSTFDEDNVDENGDGNDDGQDDGNYLPDELDELHKSTVLDNVDIFGQLKAILN